MKTHLSYTPKVTLNSRKHRIRCTNSWPCKRMNCERCYERRRWFFIERGAIHAIEKGLSQLVTVSWVCPRLGDLWIRLTSVSNLLAKTLSGIKAGPFIRVISLGEKKRTPHIHYLVGEKMARLIRSVSHKKWPRQVMVQIKPAHDIRGLLGYFFDQNFRPSFLDSSRVKGIRLLSASRPMTTGFPSKLQIYELAKLTRSQVKKERRAGSDSSLLKVQSNGNGKEGGMDGEIQRT